MIPVLILVSDCRPNVSIRGHDPVEEAKEVCRIIRAEAINSLVIDTENEFIQLRLGSQLAEIMDGQYYKLNQLQASEIEGAVRSYLQKGY